MKLKGMTASEVTIAAKMNGMHYGQFSFLAECGMVAIPPLSEIRAQMVVKKKRGTKPQPVCQYDMKGEYIATYATTGDAALAIGKERSANSSIRNACIGNMNSAYGFQWRFEGDNPPGIYVNRGKMPIRKTTLVDKVCVRCGKPYRGVARSLYCSGDCANAAKLESNQKYKEKIKQQTKEQNTRQAVCKFCGKRFTTTRSNVAYCSSICQHRYNSRLQHERKMAQNRKAGA